MMTVEAAILLSYLVTVVSETAAIISLRRMKNIRRWAIGVFLINSFSQPLAVYFILIRELPYVPIELGVFAVEVFWYYWAFDLRLRNAVFLSATANVSSIVTGAVIRVLLGL